MSHGSQGVLPPLPLSFLMLLHLHQKSNWVWKIPMLLLPEWLACQGWLPREEGWEECMDVIKNKVCWQVKVKWPLRVVYSGFGRGQLSKYIKYRNKNKKNSFIIIIIGDLSLGNAACGLQGISTPKSYRSHSTYMICSTIYIHRLLVFYEDWKHIHLSGVWSAWRRILFKKHPVSINVQ